MRGLIKRLTAKHGVHVWKKRAALIYAIGTWTLGGTILLMYFNPRDIWGQITKPFISSEESELEKQGRLELQKLEQSQRKQATAEYVADNYNFTMWDYVA